MNEKANIQEYVAERFKAYLIANRCRQTKERYAILHAIYNIEGTFTIEDLQTVMQGLRFPVSTGTLYTTTQLLVQANLLIRHPFSSSSTVFERIIDDSPRSYQVCGNCHRITRIKSKELSTSIETYHTRTFSISHRIVYIYGTCASCRRKMHKQLKAEGLISKNADFII